jgi:hypothetical protein
MVNQMCKRGLGLHCHHIRFRRDGGRTAIGNLIPVCGRCHSLVHMGSLCVTRAPDGELRWETKSDRIAIDPEPERKELSSVPTVTPSPSPSPSAPVPPSPQASETPVGIPTGPQDAGSVPPIPPRMFETMMAALRTLKYNRTEARERIQGGWERLHVRGKPFHEVDLLRAALGARLDDDDPATRRRTG